MSAFHIVPVFAKGMAWRCTTLLIVLLMIGVMGTYTAAIYVHQLAPLKYFDNADTHDLLYVIDLMESNTERKDDPSLINLLDSRPEIDTVYEYYSRYFTANTEIFFPGILTCFSGDYLDALHWPLANTLSPGSRLPNTVSVWADARMKDQFAAGDIFPVTITDDELRTASVNVQIVGFLPVSGMYPDKPVFWDLSAPDINGLVHFLDRENDPMILVADLNQLAQLLQAEGTSSFTVNAKPVALRLRKGLTDDDISSLQRDLYVNVQAAVYTSRQIREYSLSSLRESMKRNNNNVAVLTYVVLCGIAAIETSMIHRKSKEANVLRLIGVSWSSMRRAWQLILLPMCCLTTFIGALLTEFFSSPMDAFLVLHDEPWLRLLPVLAVLLVTLIVNLISFAVWRERHSMEENRVC